MEQYLTAHVILAVLGGVVGGFRAAVRGRPTRPIMVRVSDFLVGVAIAGATSTYAPPEYPFLALAYGVVAGTVSAFALDTLYDMIPAIMRFIAKVRFNLDLPSKNKD